MNPQAISDALHSLPPQMPFEKMHGLGNDFVVIDTTCAPLTDFKMTRELAIALCDRRFGIGADQLLFLRPPLSAAPKSDAKMNPSAVIRMDIWDADGSTAEMCGNGIRAVGLYLRCRGFSETELRIETEAGLKIITDAVPVETSVNQKTAVSHSKARGFFKVDMGPPKFGRNDGRAEKLELGSSNEDVEISIPLRAKGVTTPSEVHFHEVSMGNPHAVIFVDSLERSKSYVRTVGPLVEKHHRFPKKTNVEFVFGPIRPDKENQIPLYDVNVWERGAGVTLACGTGACAVAATLIQTKRATSQVRVRMPGGELLLEWSGMPGDPIYMTGPADWVFSGTISS